MRPKGTPKWAVLMTPAQGRALRRLAAKPGISRYRIAKCLGIHQSTVDRWCDALGIARVRSASVATVLQRAKRHLPQAHAEGCSCSLECEMVAFRKRALELRIQRIVDKYPQKEIAA